MQLLQHIFLSPHFDDAALSCGGLLAQLNAAGARTAVATSFGGKPDYARLSPFARSIHGRPLAGQDPIDQRRAEERQALALLGAESWQGDYLDCIYRQDAAEARWLYASESALFGPVDTADEALVEALARWLAALAPAPDRAVLYAPLAIGNHVDHQIVQRSAFLLRQRGYAVHFYEDYPYSARDPGGLEQALSRLAQRGPWQSALVQLSQIDLRAKIAAIMAYTSQLGVLFPGDGAVMQRVSVAVLEHAQRTGQDQYAERLWQLQP